eukprot:3420183-Pyramimonas_sp.AAC.1
MSSQRRTDNYVVIPTKSMHVIDGVGCHESASFITCKDNQLAVEASGSDHLVYHCLQQSITMD